MRSLLFRLTFSIGLVAMLVFGAVSASAREVPEGPTLVVANPSPGDNLTPGKLEMQGVAFDPVAPIGTGVDRVSVFLDNRDTGGVHLGDATLGAPNPMPSEPAQFALAGWTLTTSALQGVGDGHTLFIYAHSAMTNQESIVQIPITIGSDPSKTTIGPGGGEATAPAPDNLPSPVEGPADTSGM
jgi:hypothetical protein